MKLAQRQSLVLESEAVMNGFCYAYSHALFVKLRTLLQQEKYFEEGNENAQESPNANRKLSEIASVTLYALSEQIAFHSNDFHQGSWNNIQSTLGVVDEFLAIFERK